jgi:hypothetical protein
MPYPVVQAWSRLCTNIEEVAVSTPPSRTPARRFKPPHLRVRRRGERLGEHRNGCKHPFPLPSPPFFSPEVFIFPCQVCELERTKIKIKIETPKHKARDGKGQEGKENGKAEV